MTKRKAKVEISEELMTQTLAETNRLVTVLRQVREILDQQGLVAAEKNLKIRALVERALA